MKILSFFLAVTILGSCQPVQPPDYSSYSYSQITGLTIPWEKLLEGASQRYFVLVFSQDCSHCRAIEGFVVHYALTQPPFPLFFVAATLEIPIGSAIESTYGAKSIDAIFIRGWPTLMDVADSTLIEQDVGEEDIRRKLS